MTGEALVLLHGSANGAYSWGPVRQALAGREVYAPDMLGYGASPAPSERYGIGEEVAHLVGRIDARGYAAVHLVAHSLGAMFGLHLRRALGGLVTRLTLIDPVVVSVLRAPGEDEGFAEMEAQYQRFMGKMPDHAAAARVFVEHWSGAGAWDAIGDRARAVLTALAPKVGLEMVATRDDRTLLAELAGPPLPTTVLVGERTRVAPRATARLLAGALRAETVVVPGAGHMIPLTHAAAVVAAVQRGAGP